MWFGYMELGTVQVSCVLKSSDGLRTYVSVARGFVKRRLLEVVLSCRLESYCPDPRPVWESRMKEYVISVLGNIRGHSKLLKTIFISDSPRREIIRNAETRIMAVP